MCYATWVRRGQSGDERLVKKAEMKSKQELAIQPDPQKVKDKNI